MRLSGLLIVQNEERYLARALANLRPHVDELVVVDGGSVDSSVSIAKSFGARVEVKPFEYDFAEQRNYGISLCQGEWVLSLDADEYFDPKVFEILPELMSSLECDVFRFRRDNLYLLKIPNPFFRYWKWFRDRYDYQEKLYRNSVRFSGSLHEKILGNRRTQTRSEKVIHDKTYERQEYSNQFYHDLASGKKNYPGSEKNSFDDITRERRH